MVCQHRKGWMCLRGASMSNVLKLKGEYTMKKALIIANMLFASAAVWGMNVSLVNQKNNKNVFVETKDLSEHEQKVRAQMIQQIYNVSYSTDFQEIDKNFKIAKKSLINPNVLGLLLSYKNKKPLTDQQIKNLMVNLRVLNSIDQDENTLLSYTIKSFYEMKHVGGGDGWNAGWNREKLILLSSYMLEYGADPFLKMDDEHGPLMEQVKERYSGRWLDDEEESSALKNLISTYEKATKKLEEHRITRKQQKNWNSVIVDIFRTVFQMFFRKFLTF